MDAYPKSSGNVQVVMENSAKIGRILTGDVCFTPHMITASLVGDDCDLSASGNAYFSFRDNQWFVRKMSDKLRS